MDPSEIDGESAIVHTSVVMRDSQGFAKTQAELVLIARVS